MSSSKDKIIASLYFNLKEQGTPIEVIKRIIERITKGLEDDQIV